ncbi:MAG: DUF1294 domain-containing protein [Clostridia bacterium]|nr:DUF1294 domain-containing protein [Clostridia bacterium]
MPYLYLVYLLALSIVAFCLYGIDKYRAKRHFRRVPEVTLLSLGFLGGAVGALCAMQLFRHKTKHKYFYAVNLLGIVWQLGLFVLLFLKNM